LINQSQLSQLTKHSYEHRETAVTAKLIAFLQPARNEVPQVCGLVCRPFFGILLLHV